MMMFKKYNENILLLQELLSYLEKSIRTKLESCIKALIGKCVAPADTFIKVMLDR